MDSNSSLSPFVSAILIIIFQQLLLTRSPVAARLKAACGVVSQYLSPDMSQILMSSYEFVSSPSLMVRCGADKIPHVSFYALDQYVSNLAAEEQPPLDRTVDNKKKSMTSNGTADLKVVKGAKGSRGAKALKKVDITGMSKLSNFFKKKDEVANAEA